MKMTAKDNKQSYLRYKSRHYINAAASYPTAGHSFLHANISSSHSEAVIVVVSTEWYTASSNQTNSLRENKVLRFLVLASGCSPLSPWKTSLLSPNTRDNHEKQSGHITKSLLDEVSNWVLKSFQLVTHIELYQ